MKRRSFSMENKTPVTEANVSQQSGVVPVSDQIPVTTTQDSGIDCRKMNETSGLASPSVSSGFEICKTLQILEEGEKKIVLNEEYKNLTLVIGNTGAGKSTFVQWIVGDNQKLISKEVEKDSGEYVIEDGKRISNSNSTTESKTLFPELVLDHETHSAYYDCPGFMDTRSTSHDIATTYFIKKVADHAENVKLLLVVSHPSVRKGVLRQDFLTLLRHTTDLLKDIDKFRNSVAMAVTKVDNLTRRVGKNFLLTSDEQIIGAVGDFLKELQLVLKITLQDPNLSEKRKVFYQKSVGLIDMLLIRDGENYKRIGIFRRPDEPGPLSNIPLLQEGKGHILKILNDNLQFTQVRDDDFGYTVSEKSKNDINDLIDVINENVWSLVGNLVENAKTFYRNLTEIITKVVKNIDTGNVEINAEDARIILDKLDMGEKVTRRLLNEIKDVNTHTLAIKINETIGTLGIVRSEDDLSNILSYGKFYAFLQTVGDKKYNSRPWEMLLRDIPEYLTKAKIKIDGEVVEKTRKIENNILSNVQQITSAIKKHYQNRMQTLDAEELILELKKGHDLVSRMNKEIKSLNTAQELAQTIRDNILLMYVDISEIRKFTNQIFHFGENLQYLKAIGSREWTQPHSWTYSIGEIEKYLQESLTWYTFLSDLNSKLSKYSGQFNKSKLSSHVTERRLSEFWNNIKELSVSEYDIVKNMEVSGLRLEELNNILYQNVKDNMIRNCDGDKLVIKADYVKFSDFIKDDGSVSTGCSDYVKTIQIFASDTLFIDRDLRANGRKLKVIALAPKWDVIGIRVIDLSGADGMENYPYKNYGGGSSGQSGQNGLAGKPGGSAGSFFGIGTEFLGGSNLKIFANGGNGGRGQDGGDGAKGSDGATPSKNPDYYHDNYYCRETLCEGNSDNRMRSFDCEYHLGTDEIFESVMSFGLSLPEAGVIIFGKGGSRGGNGGNGGRGGIGGKAGDIRIISLANDAHISVTQHPGERGAPGNGGRKGVGGAKGGDLIMSCKQGEIGTGWREFWRYLPVDDGHIYNPKRNSPGEDGVDGVSGGSDLGLKNPEEPVLISNPVQILKEYKNYLKGNLNNANNLFRKKALIGLLRRLDNVDTVKIAMLANHRLGRRSVETPASSSAGRPSSWIKNAWVLAKSSLTEALVSLGAMTGSVMDVLYPMVFDDELPGAGPCVEHKHITEHGHSSMSCHVQQGSTVLEMGDLLVNNTEINGLLIWGTLLAMKCTGRSPKSFVSQSHDKSHEIILDIRSREFVDELLKILQENVKVFGTNALDILNNPELYKESVKIARRLLVKEDLESMSNLIFEKIKKVTSKSSIKPNKTNQFLVTVKRELPVIILEVASKVRVYG